VLLGVDLFTLFCFLVGFDPGCRTFSLFCIERSTGCWGNGYFIGYSCRLLCLLRGTFNIIMLVIPLVPTWNMLEVCAEIQ
jgi:hypothetical protein